MNGYRSLHLIISVPVYFSDHKEQIRVEVQIRTIAMDFWASLEHQVKYKKNVKDAESVMYELRGCDQPYRLSYAVYPRPHCRNRLETKGKVNYG